MFCFQLGVNVDDSGFQTANFGKSQRLVQVEGTMKPVPEPFSWIRLDRCTAGSR